jgi:hypothetical protein
LSFTVSPTVKPFAPAVALVFEPDVEAEGAFDGAVEVVGAVVEGSVVDGAGVVAGVSDVVGGVVADSGGVPEPWLGDMVEPAP